MKIVEFVFILYLLICEINTHEYLMSFKFEEKDSVLFVLNNLKNDTNFNYTYSFLNKDKQNDENIIIIKTNEQLELNALFPNNMIHENKIHSGSEEETTFLRKLDENNFLNHNITKTETLLEKYLSTKYLFWQEGFKGNNVKVGICDSGINNTHLNCNLEENINFTDEEDNDLDGHGTFLASV
jgi:subtilisin family serine protease